MSLRVRTATWMPLVLLPLLALLPAAYATGGSPDPAFGTGGVVVSETNFGPPQAVAAGADGSVVVAGWEGTGASTSTGEANEWVVRRYDAQGDADASFGAGGSVRLFGSYSEDRATDALIDGSGRIVVVGTSGVAGKGKSWKVALTLVRLTAEGDLDATFGEGGVVRTAPSDVSEWIGRLAIARQSDGKLVVGGAAWVKVKAKRSTTEVRGFWVARYLPSGALDTTFDGDGIAFRADVRAGITHPQGRPLGLQSTGAIVLGGLGWAMVRFLSNGDFDGSFAPSDSEGDELHALAIDGSDRVVAAGARGSGSAMAPLVRRHLAGGATDSTFGDSGDVLVDLTGRADGLTSGLAAAVALDGSSGDVLLALSLATADLASAFDAAPMRLHADGTLDGDFGTGGVGPTIGVSTRVWAYGVTLRATGDVLLLGYDRTVGDPRWVLAAYLGS